MIKSHHMLRPLSRLRIVRTLIPVLGDIVILYAALAASLYLRQPSLLRTRFMLYFSPLFALFLMTFYAAGLYELRRVRDFVSLISGLMISGVVCWVLGTFYFYFLLPYFWETPKTHLALTVAFAHVAMLGWRRVILAMTDFSLMRLRLLVLASDQHLMHLRLSQSLRSGEGLDLAGALGADVDLVVADSAWIEEHWGEVKSVLSAAVEQKVPIVSLDAFYESMFGKVSPYCASNPSWALEHILPRAGGLYFKVRRVFDVLISALGLVILSPLLILTAVLIRLVDGMSPIYRQERVGFLGRIFTLWKFRTMRPNADVCGPFMAREGADERVTPLGRALRRFRFDELPQLWNVVRGDMSLVGPRPEWVKEVEILESMVPNYHLRHLVPPGITGWAQVYYRATNDPRDSIEKHHYDLYYLKHFSPALDLSILLKTIKRVFVHDARVASTLTPFPAGAARMSQNLVDLSSIISRN